jgi:hypothetical protein
MSLKDAGSLIVGAANAKQPHDVKRAATRLSKELVEFEERNLITSAAVEAILKAIAQKVGITSSDVIALGDVAAEVQRLLG